MGSRTLVGAHKMVEEQLLSFNWSLLREPGRYPRNCPREHLTHRARLGWVHLPWRLIYIFLHPRVSHFVHAV